MMRYGYNLQPRSWERAPLEAGIAIHKALEQHYQGQPLRVVLKTFRAHYYEYALNHVEPTDRLAFNNILECVESWVVRHPLAALPYQIPTPDHIEMAFDVPLDPADPTIRYVGRIDALVARKQTTQLDSQYIRRDALYVLDTKSSGAPYGDWALQFELSPQLTGYVWAASQLFPEQPIAGCYINCVHTLLLPTSAGKCRKHGTSYPECRFLHPQHQLVGPLLRPAGEIEQWRKDAYALARLWKSQLDDQETHGRDLSRLPMFGKWLYNVCPRCELRRFCQTGRDMNNYDFIQVEWVPGDLAQR